MPLCSLSLSLNATLAMQPSLPLLQSLPPQVGTTRPPPPLCLPLPLPYVDLKVIGLRIQMTISLGTGSDEVQACMIDKQPSGSSGGDLCGSHGLETQLKLYGPQLQKFKEHTCWKIKQRRKEGKV
ncbi:uncharacterized protein LOC131241417 isoform X2 [Magnolia sinica]|uniref:uncharacterized protein LOC131241417 isoform X2 n=1 Tax=Magnolia sinica TaxID=86752 RepID=UPI002659F4CD|nr:uncharacterized protein LOC131241417 isoform X2 [Magnolia sinica]